MIGAAASHAARLITFRHNGEGLNARCMKTVLLLISATSAVAFARWGVPSQAAAHAALVMLMCIFSIRVAMGYALISIGIDIVAIAAWFAPKEVFSLWELCAQAWLAFRCGIESRRGCE